MPHQRIRYFLEAADAESFSQAAARLFVSPQALTKQINLLEEELGGRLFERTKRGVALTPLGRYAKESFEKIHKELEITMEELKTQAREHKNRLNIGIFSALPKDALITPLISFLLVNFPAYEIRLNLIDLEEGRKLLQTGHLDILLTNTHEQDDWGPMCGLSFGEYPARIIVSLRHPWAMKDSVTLDDMHREIFIKMHIDPDNYTVTKEESFYENMPCRKVREVENFDTMVTLLEQGDAFAVFPMYFTYMDQARIKSFPYPGKSLIFHTALLYNPANPLPGLSKIIEEIQGEFELKAFL